MAPASKLQKKENEIGCFVAQRFADWYHWHGVAGGRLRFPAVN